MAQRNDQEVGSRAEAPSGFVRYRLRTLLIMVTAFAISFAWRAEIARRQAKVFRFVHEHGGTIVFEFQEDSENYLNASAPIRNWLASKIGDEYIFSIAGVALEGTDVDDDVIGNCVPLLEDLSDLRWVDLKGTTVTNESMEAICQLKSLERLFLRPADLTGIISPNNQRVPIRITDAGLQPLADLKNLKVLSLGYAPITGRGFQHIRTLSTLEELDFRCTDVVDDSLEYLADLQNLRRINLWDTKVTDKGLAHLSELRQLEALYLSGTGVSDGGMEFIAGRRSLRVLDVSRTNVGDVGLVAISNLDRLEELRLGMTAVSDSGLIHLAKLKNLQILELKGTKVTDASVASLESFKQLKRLEIPVGSSGFTNAGSQRLRKALPQCKIR